MPPFLVLALKSIDNRRTTALLTVATIALSVALLLGVERLSNGARESFQNTISGTDLIVGARGGQLPLLLYSVFRLGDPTNNITWVSYREFADHPEVAWTVPISLGDSHLGYRVVGTDDQYLAHYRYGRDTPLTVAQGRWFDEVFDVVLGAEVAEALGYTLEQEITLSHGVTAVSFQPHDDKPFRIVGILAPTGTPVDRTLHVSLEGIEAIHVDWQGGAPPPPGQAISAEEALTMDLQPQGITAFLVGLRSPIGIFQFQREVNNYRAEPLMAVLPGVALQRLWGLLGTADTALTIISAFVVLVGLTGMLAVILTSLNERRREMAILRSVGARPWHIFALLLCEALLLAFLGCLLGLGLLYGLIFVIYPAIEAQLGLYLPVEFIGAYDLAILGAVVGGGLIMGLIPAWRAYRQSLADGLTVNL
ncbi:MAG: ABC transporter permease [Candidatus Competibacterales bacterium]